MERSLYENLLNLNKRKSICIIWSIFYLIEAFAIELLSVEYFWNAKNSKHFRSDSSGAMKNEILKWKKSSSPQLAEYMVEVKGDSPLWAPTELNLKLKYHKLDGIKKSIQSVRYLYPLAQVFKSKTLIQKT